MTAADVMPALSYSRPLTAFQDAPGATWTFRHPDAEGSQYTGPVRLPGERVLDSERGFVTTSLKSDREALQRMGWILWRTDVEGARPAIFDNVR